MSSQTKEVRDIIKTRGYWEIEFRPLEFKKNRLESVSECLKKVGESVVELRGWPYPAYLGKIPYPLQERIEAVIDSNDLKEYWTMFLSGHFYHIFACREDWLGKDMNIVGPNSYSAAPLRSFLEFMMTLYSVTEIYEFAIRLAQKNVFGKGLHMKIQLHGMEGRKLTTFEPLRIPFFRDYVCRQKDLIFEEKVSVDKLIGEGHEIALHTVFKIFETFNWSNTPKERLKEDQKRFLEKRL